MSFEGTPSSRPSKWAATWYVDSSGPKPLMASLIQTQSRGWPLKVLDLSSQHVKRGLISKLWMRAFSWYPSNPLNSFFVISTFPAGLCISSFMGGYLTWIEKRNRFAQSYLNSYSGSQYMPLKYVQQIFHAKHSRPEKHHFHSIWTVFTSFWTVCVRAPYDYCCGGAASFPTLSGPSPLAHIRF